MHADPFVAQLAGLCREFPTRAKWVFVPTHAVGLTLGDRLAREGTSWVNLHFVTPLDVAIPMAAPFLVERGVIPSEEPLGAPLVMRLLLGLPVDGGYFRPMAEHASMAEALWRTIRELRQSGLRSADLDAQEFTSPAKHAELSALLAAYERHLAARPCADMPMALEEAARHGDHCPVRADDLVTELPGTLWSPVVRTFLDALPGQRVAPVTLSLPGGEPPRRAATLAARATAVEAITPTDAGRLRFLLAPGEAPPARGDASLDIFHAGGPEAEIAEVLRRILASGMRLDQVEVVCASGAYPLLAWEKALNLGWPVTVSTGMPVTRSRAGRLLLRFCDWVAADFAAADLRRLLQSGDCSGRALDASARECGGGDEADVSPGQGARLLLKAQATWGRDTYAAALSRLAGKYRQRADDEEASEEQRTWNARKAAQTTTLQRWVTDTVRTFPAPDTDGTVSLLAVAKAASAFVDANALRAGAVDGLAQAAVLDALNDLEDLGDYRCPLDAALRFVRERVESATAGRDRPRPGHLHVSTLDEAGYDGRPMTFVIGVQEAAVFPSAIEDPVLLDEERRAISPMLRTSRDHLDETVFAAVSRLAAIGASSTRVCLSFSCRDTREFRETSPSWVVIQAFRLMRGDAGLGYDDLATWLGEPASAVPTAPGDSTTALEWWLAGAVSRSAARPEVLDAFPALARGIAAEESRASASFTGFDGFVPAAGPILDPSRTGRPISATSLERAAECPFRFLLEQGLGVKALEEGSAETDVWLDAATRGIELHDLFARIMRAVRSEERKPSLEIDRPRLHAWGQARLAELKAQIPPPSDEVFARESAALLDDLEAFITAECEGHHGDAVGLEVSFGFPVQDEEDGAPEPLAREELLGVDLGSRRRINLHGRIDRINHLGGADYEVVDYKTGRYWADAWKGDFAGGTRLQHALYGMAAQAALRTEDAKASVVRGVYLFPSVRGHRRRKVIDTPSRTTIVGVLRDLTDVIGDGAFAPAESPENCRWCDYAAACHAEGADRAAGKIADEANTVLDAYRRLRSHE